MAVFKEKKITVINLVVQGEDGKKEDGTEIIRGTLVRDTASSCCWLCSSCYSHTQHWEGGSTMGSRMVSAAHFGPDLTPQNICRMHKITAESVRVLGLEAAPCHSAMLQQLDGGTCPEWKSPTGMKNTDPCACNPGSNTWNQFSLPSAHPGGCSPHFTAHCCCKTLLETRNPPGRALRTLRAPCWG